ncbi:hypothetical protein BHE97_11465 [Aeromicrobium sp. PE09-221]|nr:hypothetical protein BHE97_11465 [Aeromicrobium sp. PE09-221]
MRVVLVGLLVALAVPAGVGTAGAVFTATTSSETQQAGTATLPAVDGAQATRTPDGTADLSWTTPIVRTDVAPDYTIERAIGDDTTTLTPDITADSGGTTAGFTDDLTTPAEIEGKPVTAVTAGGFHTCAIADARAYCWGWNAYGQLGNTTTDSSVPVAVTGLDDPVTAITAGWAHTCAVTDAGTAYCWGLNGGGQLGINTTTTNSAVPVEVAELDNPVTAITAGFYHTCAITNTAHCWGYNLYGQLGNDSTENSSTPVAVTGLDDPVTAITAGGYHTCAIASTDPSAGIAHCWGNNSDGQLGNNTTTSSAVPVEVAELDNPVTAISTGLYHTCAIASTDPSAGIAHCWGNNSDGQLGNNTTTSSAVPVEVAGLDNPVTAITAGDTHTCAIASTDTSAGIAHCWGYNGYGRLGDGTTIDRAVPVDVDVEIGVLGRNWTCAQEDWQLIGDPDDPEPQACAPGPNIPVAYRLAYTKAGWESPNTSVTTMWSDDQ